MKVLGLTFKPKPGTRLLTCGNLRIVCHGTSWFAEHDLVAGLSSMTGAGETPEQALADLRTKVLTRILGEIPDAGEQPCSTD